MSERHGIIDTIVDNFVPVHGDGHKFIAVALGLALLFFLIWPPLAWLLVIVACYIAYFFRDPDRVTPQREGLIVAPADGRVTAVEAVRPPVELGLGPEERVRISTFLSVLDVHITRSPVAGKIVRSIYVPGAFLNAALDKASEENERRAIIIEKPDGVEIASGSREASATASSALARASIFICRPVKPRSFASASSPTPAKRCSPTLNRPSQSGWPGGADTEI